MALTSSIDALVEVEYSQFFVTTGTSDDDVGPIFSSTEDFIEVGEGSVLCISALGTHHAGIRLEYWTAPPPALADWEREQTVDVRRNNGPAFAISLMGRRACELDLPITPGDPVRMKVACRGRSKVREVFIAEQEPPSGVEQWLVQFWHPTT